MGKKLTYSKSKMQQANLLFIEQLEHHMLRFKVKWVCLKQDCQKLSKTEKLKSNSKYRENAMNLQELHAEIPMKNRKK